MNLKSKVVFVALVALLLAAPTWAGYVVSVGYADGLRSGGFFPNPWNGIPGVALFAGDGSLTPDSGGIMITNTGASNIQLQSLQADIKDPGSIVGLVGTGTGNDIWSAFLFGAGFTLAPGQSAIFENTSGTNFDTSDFPVLPGVGPGSPCLGLVTDPPACKDPANIPTVTVMVDGVSTTFSDTGHVLDTGGFDFAQIGNESHAWRPIGTIGGQGGVPEPSSIVLLGSGLLGCLALVRRRIGQRQ